jgi:hypothetical protein
MSTMRGPFRRLSERSVPTTASHRPNLRAKAALVSVLAIGYIFTARAAAQDRQSFQHPSSIRGTVINGVTHEPIAHALVYTSDDRFAGWTDSDGHFDYPLPKTVTDVVSFPGGQLYGFPPIYYTGAADFTVATSIQLKSGDTFETDLSPVRQPNYPVQIPLADESRTSLSSFLFKVTIALGIRLVITPRGTGSKERFPMGLTSCQWSRLSPMPRAER